MVKTVIAVDEGLSPVRNYLTKQGCQIINIDAAKNQQVDAIVLSGKDKNFLGMEDIMINAPVISAQGVTPQEIWRDIQQAVKLKQ